MGLPKRYDPTISEPALQDEWQSSGIYQFDPEGPQRVYAIDTPPATVSGHLHLGHAFSYSHADFMARFWRMRGRNVFYPMGFDDNGLPTERLVEKRKGITARQVGRAAFIEQCLQMSVEAERDYQQLWQRLGLSIDWRYTYRTIDDYSRRVSQASFIELYRQGLVYRQEAPTIWCPECQTAIAQAELNDLERESEFVSLPFYFEDQPEEFLEIATTRPELLPACVAVFVHPGDARYAGLAGRQVRVPVFGQRVPVLEDPAADPEKGSGAVMCCTFGDSTDVNWWYSHHLPLISAISPQGTLTDQAGLLAGLSISDARQKIKTELQSQGLLLNRQPTRQSVRVHERCDTPVEYIVTRQWFIRVLEARETFLQAGKRISWHPSHMQARYLDWVENLGWDWCISRQRYFGVPFPLWYCQACGEVVLATEAQLPVDPGEQDPQGPCPNCGGQAFLPEKDVMDTWATSSMTPQIVGRWLPESNGLFQQVFPFSLRPQAHEIIRTWAFYTIVKSHYHFQKLPWSEILISGWGLAGEGMGKISKSRGGGPMAPLEMIERYSADAVRYWAASASPGKDTLISEEKIQLGAKLVTKLWNVARFSERFLEGYSPDQSAPASLTPADRWILARGQHLVERATSLLESYDYASAKNETEVFFWTELADNYLEMCKQRLYDAADPSRPGAQYSLYFSLLTVLKLLAPFLPHVTEAIYLQLFASLEGRSSIHRSAWPAVNPALVDASAEQFGQVLVSIASAVRRFKSDHNLPLGADLDQLQLATDAQQVQQELEQAAIDLKSITRAQRVLVSDRLEPGAYILELDSAEIRAALSNPTTG